MNSGFLHLPQKWFQFVWILLALILISGEALAARSAVILMYHRFGESTYPTTNTTVEQLENHIAELNNGPYTVLPVPEIIGKIKRGENLPEYTIGITIDDAYKSVFDVAFPRFKAANLPFTVFVATGTVDQEISTIMSWKQISQMKEKGVTIGHHSVSHPHMHELSIATNQSEIRNASQRFEEMLGERPALFAYPYGEKSLEIQSLMKEVGFKAAFGQHSGAIDSSSDIFDLPRFSMNEKYGELERFRLVVQTLPIPAVDLTPMDTLITDNNPPAMGFTIASDIGDLKGLSCFVQGHENIQLEKLGSVRVEVRVQAPFKKGRTRLNCTIPGPDGRWRWFGRQFIVK